MSEFAAVLELSSLDGLNGFQIQGAEVNYQSGYSVASAGDVNNDGFDDLIIGAPSDHLQAYTGASYVVFGKASGFGAVVELSSLDGFTGFQINGEAAGDRSGFSVASAGDVNGDGFDDLIVGAYKADPNGLDAGASYVVFGKPAGFGAELELSSLDGVAGFKINGEIANDQSGGSVASAGDINGDGFDDLLIGARFADPNGGYSGASYVVFGKASSFGAALELSSLDGLNGFQINGELAGNRSGWAVASAGDVNGDGFDDLIVGAKYASFSGYNAGASYVVFGKASGFGAALELSSLDGDSGFQINGEASEDRSGTSVASAGDINGDGFDDLIVGATLAQSNGIRTGASFVVFGKASGFDAELELSNLNGANGFKINGEALYDQIGGTSVASAGDVNGDGFDDVIVGAVNADPHGNETGASYVVFGRATGFDAELELSSLDGVNGFQINGEAATEHSGWSVASAGDVNGDGFDDLIVGAKYADRPLNNSGASYVIFGRAPDAAVGRIGSAASQAIRGGDFNDLLSGLGGRDTLVGAVGDDTLLGGAGRDVLVGGKGFDTASFADAVQGVTADLGLGGHQYTGEGLDRLRSIENLTGSDFSDALTGGAGANVLNGGHGDDTLTGGGRGDMLTGGAGEDTFVYLEFSDSSGRADRITDLTADDVIDLSAIDAIKGGGDDAFTQVAQFTGARGEMRLVYVAGRDQTFLDIDIDGDKRTDFRILIDGDHTDHTGFVL